MHIHPDRSLSFKHVYVELFDESGKIYEGLLDLAEAASEQGGPDGSEQAADNVLPFRGPRR